MQQEYSISDLLEIMRKLRNPETGCPWDIEQTFETIAPYTIEEAYEVDGAIRSKDMGALEDELGDLLFQTVFHARIAEEKGAFSFDNVVSAVCDKMVRRHPHVFSDTDIADADAQTEAWEKQKAKERAKKAKMAGTLPSALDGVSIGLPALLRAIKLQKRAARVGFDWPETTQVLDKLQEECEELVEAHNDSHSQEHLREEFGDLLFVMANLARHMKIDAEQALREANAKFERRFHSVELKLSERGKTPEQSSLDEMDQLWDEVKIEERDI
ncbi:nucleoside triphosphate pyrophosphohydrolase [Kordiimonas aquimaris]|uniref:nucleoside triphosphate pyrophosphohydrolase n=1 Tax=Kordiimonas aquimaris TaxID=707591 RepID=UPI0021D2982D|nr:nucleoside triphosphate pyrophosphohydrolase [Kordiimonas aquimaris]